MANLKNYKVEVINPATDTVVLTVTPSSDPATEPVLGSLSFTNNRLGGCGSARVTLNCASDTVLYGAPLTPLYHLRISLRCGAEASDLVRFYGYIETCDIGYGTDPRSRDITAVGLFKSLKKFPLLLFLDDKTPAAAVRSIIQQSGGITDHLYIANDITKVEDGTTYNIEEVDFADTWAADALKIVATVEGSTCIYGVDTSKRIYFRNMSVAGLDPGFRVGVNLAQTEWSRSAADQISGALVTHQRKVGGGNLTLFVTNPAVTKPWSIAKVSVPELVPSDAAYRYGVEYVAMHDSAVDDASFDVLDFGEQLWPDEIIYQPLVCWMRATGSSYYATLYVDSYTVTVSGDGSVKTTFQLGADPMDKLNEAFRDIMREIEATKARELWTAAELVAANDDDMRSVRRGLGKMGYRNVWMARVESADMLVQEEDWSASNVPATSLGCATLDLDAGVIRGPGMIVTPFIPTGLVMANVRINGVTVGRTYLYNDENIGTLDEGGVDTWGHNAIVGVSPGVRSGSTFDGSVEINQLYTDDILGEAIAESPLTIEVYRPCISDDTTVPANFAAMCALTGYTDIMFAGNRSQDSPRYYCLRIYRTSSTSSDVYVAMGWVEGGAAMHGNHWDGTPPFGSFDIGTDYPDSSYNSNKFLTIKCTLPLDDGDSWTVTIYREGTTTVLWTGTGTVQIGGSDAWTPEDERLGGMRWKNYTGRYTLIHGLRRWTCTASTSISTGATRDGVNWNYGALNAATVPLTTQNEHWEDGRTGLVLLISLPDNTSIRGIGAGFKEE